MQIRTGNPTPALPQWAFVGPSLQPSRLHLQRPPALSASSVDDRIVSRQGRTLKRGRSALGSAGVAVLGEQTPEASERRDAALIPSVLTPKCFIPLFAFPQKPPSACQEQPLSPPAPAGLNADLRLSRMQQILHREPLRYLRPPFIFAAVLPNPGSPPELLRVYPSLVIVWLCSAEPSSFPGSEIKISRSDDTSFPGEPPGADKVCFFFVFLSDFPHLAIFPSTKVRQVQRPLLCCQVNDG